jgi:flagellar hook-associated protein 1 FlgK
MGGLLGSLNSSLQALRTFQTALEVSQNNVANVSTPGYAKQVATFEAMPFELGTGLMGGVESGPTQSTQNEYANQAVRTQLEQQGGFGAQSTALDSIQALFDVSGQTGVIGALNNLFESFSAWSATPTSTGAQNDVLAKAQAVAQTFQTTAGGLANITSGLNQQIQSTVQQINNIAATVRELNTQIARTPTHDAGLDAQLHASLDSLSQLANTTVLFAPDGTATVLLGGQTLLVIGQQQYSIQASFADPSAGSNANAIPNAHILDANGQDVTSQISQGSLGGLLNVRNAVLPSLQGNGSQPGALNQLAKQVADRVNQILTSATTPGGQAGSPLFTYNASSPVLTASTLALDPNITISALAPVEPGTPPVSNGAALTLANLGNSTAPADQIGGQTILQFVNSLAQQVGQQASDAQTGQSLHTQLLAQAKTLRDQVSGVSLDAEAIQVLELQKGYQAAGKMVSVIDSLTATLINMIP